MTTKTCEWCGKTFEKTPEVKRNWSRMIYCGPECRTLAENARRRTGSCHSQVERMEEWRRAREEFIDDVRLLMSSDSPPNIARRMGMSCPDIRAKLRRIHRGDLADQLLELEERYAIVRPGCFGPPAV